MHVEFTFTLDDLAEVSKRSMVQQPGYRQRRLRSLVLRGGFYAAAAYIMIPAEPPVRIGLALLSAVLGLLTDYAIAVLRRRGALRRYVRSSSVPVNAYETVEIK